MPKRRLRSHPHALGPAFGDLAATAARTGNTETKSFDSGRPQFFHQLIRSDRFGLFPTFPQDIGHEIEEGIHRRPAVWRGGGIAASFCNFGWAPGIAGARSKLPHSLAECLASPQAGAKSGRAGIAASCCKRGAGCALHTEHLSPKKSGLTASTQFQKYYRFRSGDHPLKLER